MEEDTQMKLYEELLPFARFLASRFQVGDVLVSQEDVVGELLLELVKSYQYYKGKVTYIELVKLTKTIMRNRVGELLHRYYGTSRKKAKNDYSLDYETEDETDLHEVISDESEPYEVQKISMEFFEEFLTRLSNTTREIVDAILSPSNRMMAVMELSDMRAEFVNKGGSKKLRIKPYHIANALCVSEETVIEGYYEISETLQEMYDRGV